MICYINLSFRFWLPVQRQQTGLDLQRLPAFRCSTSSSLFTSAAFSRKARQKVWPLHLFLLSPCCLRQTTSRWSPAAARPPRSLRLLPRLPVLWRPAPALADCGGPSSAPLASTSAARSCGCSPPSGSPTSCPLRPPRPTTTWSPPPRSTVAAFHAMYRPSKARMVRKAAV